MMKALGFIAMIVLAGVLWHVVASFLLAVPVWFLWSWIVTGVLGGPYLSVLEIWGLVLLIQLLVLRPARSDDA